MEAHNGTSPYSFNANSWTVDGNRITAMIICPLGILSSILTIVCLRRSNFDRDSFFVYMLLIAIFDLLFNIGYMIDRLEPRGTWAQLISFGLVYALSLYSDLFALALTIERFASLKWPHAQLSSSKMKCLRAITGVSIAVLGATRLIYLKQSISPYLSSENKLIVENVSTGIETFANMILPFVFVPPMALCSIWTVAIVRRKKPTAIRIYPRRETTSTSRIAADGVVVESPDDRRPTRGSIKMTDEQIRAAQVRKEKDDRTQSIVRLISILDVLFILNQLGYCVYAVSVLYTTYAKDRSPPGRAFENVALFLSDLLECLTRSANFYFYLCFSSLIRKQFMEFLKTIKGIFVR